MASVLILSKYVWVVDYCFSFLIFFLLFFVSYILSSVWTMSLVQNWNAVWYLFVKIEK
jgi:hypothetical protein